MELSHEKGASTWLSALPIDSNGVALHKSAFRDALSLQYIIGQLGTHTHTYTTLSDSQRFVSTEPHLLPMSREAMLHCFTVSVEDNARLDVALYSFWGCQFEKAHSEM